MLRQLALWAAVLGGAALPAAAQQTSIVRYSAPQEVPLADLPISLSVAGWPAPGFSQAFREIGRIQNQPEPTIARYEGRFAHAGYVGRVLFVETSREVRWQPPTPQDSIRDWGFFTAKPATFGATGSVINGRMTIAYVLVDLQDSGPRHCALFSGAAERAQLRGYICAVHDQPLADIAPRVIRALGHPGLLDPVEASLPVLRADTAPGGQEIVAGAVFDPRTMPFVSDAARAKLRAYQTAPQAKALALHETGAVAWVADQSSEKEAIRRALERCAYDVHATCILYAVGDRVVFHHDALINQPVVNAAGTPGPPSAGGGALGMTNAQLVAHLERATVLVVALQGHGKASVGTGFFVSPDRLLTNRHVVDGAERLLVTSRTLGKPSVAKLIAKTDRGAIGGADYALLEVPGVSHEQLAFATQVAKLQEVVAAGYPGVTIGNDEDFRAFAQGRANAAPDLVITRGEVNAIQTNNAKTPVLAHTALISEGNSGGPLVDRCGRVVGINSYLAQNTTVTGFAIAASDLIDFLTRNGMRPRIDGSPCAADAAQR
jgi:S1-C subfamily serine protease